ncbi:uncharacterized protein LOC142098577 [Mixophyes fleayi]|uniref:uncharacterized protein LOC142098577 n=1 Tax=Mixophyes fleayi TaxID=3061075 RepID=UPI003F4DD878
MSQIKAVVGIFSHEDQSTYEWLIRFLLSSSAVKDVRPVYIPRDSWNIRHEIPQCTFAILYHTKNRGRLNITDVTDSLYDRELELLHQILKRNNVIVVIDDMDDSSDVMKTQILRSQPSIGRWAQDVILVGSQEKESVPICNNSQKCPRSGENVQQITNLVKAQNRRRLRKKLCKNISIIILILLIIILVIALLVRFLHILIKH